MTAPPKTCRWLLTAGLLAIAGCAHSPGFESNLPSALSFEDKAIAIIGDLQQTPAFVRFARRREDTAEAQSRLIADLRSQAADLAALAIVGDLVYSARSRRDWQHLDMLIAAIADQVPVLPAAGNHDYPCYFVQLCRTGRLPGGMLERFPWLQPGQAYRVEAGDVVLLFLDSESRLPEQAQWLRLQLDEATRRHRAAVVLHHRPAWSNSIDKTASGNEDVERILVPVLRDAKLPVIVFNGHIHGFEHFLVDGMHFVTSAGGGGPRVPMPPGPPQDLYTGVECNHRNGGSLRPFNYVLLRRDAARLTVEVRGFCGGDEAIRRLYSFAVEL